MTVAEKLVELLKAQGLTCATAESCTGGGVGSAITAVPGSSAVFAGGVISYANEVKRDVLGAKRFGIRSVLLSWSPRYDMVPSCEEETPDYVISRPEELLELANRLDALLS